MFLSLPMLAQELGCAKDIVLFTDDFGGNDPTDRAELWGDALRQFPRLSKEFLSYNAFRLLKKWNGSPNCYHPMIDHTFPGDPDRGYFLNVLPFLIKDRPSFYSVVVDSLQSGQILAVSYYFYPSCCREYMRQYKEEHPDYIPLSMQIEFFDAKTGELLNTYTSPPMQPDTIHECGELADWVRIETSYVVPKGVPAVKVGLNLLWNYTHNDWDIDDMFIDDIEIKMLVPSVDIIATDTVCAGTKNILKAKYSNQGYLSTPLSYQWYFSPDSITWEPLQEGNDTEYKFKAQPSNAGWYCVQVSSSDEEDDKCVLSDPFKLYVIEDCPPVQCADGVLLFREDFGGDGMTVSDVTGHEAIYSTTIEDVCAGSELSFFAHVSAERLLFRLVNPDTGEELAVYETGELPYDASQSSSQGQQVGMNYTVPEGVERIQLTIYNNSASTTSNTITIHDVEIRLCLEPVTINATQLACRKNSLTLEAQYDNYGILHSPEYQWSYSSDNVSWKILATGSNSGYSIPQVHKSDAGWYRVSVAEAGNSDKPHCRTESEPFRLSTIYCNTVVTQSVDTAVCDTLLPFTWRTHEWYSTGSLIDTLKDIDGDDSVHLVLSLDTFKCERLYPIVVNKYNWVLLCDQVTLRRLFGNMVIAGYQWYKDGEPVPWATEDDYSEQNELHGSYQLVIRLSDGSYVWSTIVEILDTPEPAPVRVQIYDSRGMSVQAGHVTHGIYLYRYEQDGRVWTEKKLIQ